eukprot:gene7547-8384_t
MAAVDERSQVRCKYFLHGACKLNTECPFSHDIKDKPSMVCTFYLKGECTYGKHCRYDHVKPEHLKKKDKVLKVPVQVEIQKDEKQKSIPLSRKWNVDAPVFQPRSLSHGISGDNCWNASVNEDLSVASATNGASLSHADSQESLTAEEVSHLMCPFAAVRECPYGDECYYVHGLRCDICELECLNPLDPEQQMEHRKNCLESHEKNMEYSFAVQRSVEVTCSICLDAVLDREQPGDRRFGILENCNHAFCLSCIRKWRSSSGQSKIVKACPICRISSGYVVPSEIWIENPEEKAALINGYHEALSAKDCRYFDKGNGDCPFGTSCFYRHAYADGTLEKKEKPKMRFANDADGNAKTVRNQSLWDFIDERNNR